ncbi:nicotinate phosphoribosyltransferase, partial [Vibrio cholerae O1]|nr:nicotinate phosphoribosyltransferase [Vibrio cholerae O1]
FGTQAAAQSGFGHLCSFVGSDTIPAALFAEEYYGAKIDKELVFASVDATEHSVMCSYGTEGEQASLEHLITNVTPSG